MLQSTLKSNWVVHEEKDVNSQILLESLSWKGAYGVNKKWDLCAAGVDLHIIQLFAQCGFKPAEAG